MSRSGYSDGINDWDLIRWRGAVASAIRGRRGQAFLREALDALDALPEKRLIPYRFEQEGNFCLLGAVGQHRGLHLDELPSSWDGDAWEDNYRVAEAFQVSHALVCEIQWVNDEGTFRPETPEDRFQRVRAWVVANLRGDPDA